MSDRDIPVSFLYELFEADFDKGILKWKSRPVSHFKNENLSKRWNGHYSGKVTGNKNHYGYGVTYLTYRNKRYGLLSHRVLWAMKYGHWPVCTIDHINMDRFDNCISNLREASYSQNNVNRPSRRNGLKGVVHCKQTGRYKAQISWDNKNIFLGRYKTEEEAHEVYRIKCIELYGEFAQ